IPEASGRRNWTRWKPGRAASKSPASVSSTGRSRMSRRKRAGGIPFIRHARQKWRKLIPNCLKTTRRQTTAKLNPMSRRRKPDATNPARVAAGKNSRNVVASNSQSGNAITASTARLNFGHPPETIQFWKRLVREALSFSLPTPLYIFSALPVAERISEFDAALANAGFQSAIENRQSKISYRHWLSCKTQPVAPLLRWWQEQGRGIEVVSEFELRAALTRVCAGKHSRQRPGQTSLAAAI